MNPYLNLVLSALAAALAAGGGVAATTRDPWPIAMAAITAIGIAVTQHLRQLPRQEWTEEQRAAKAAVALPQPKGTE